MKKALLVIASVSLMLYLGWFYSSFIVASKIYVGNVSLNSTQEPFEDVALSVAQAHEYDINKYNCWDYATDLVKALRSQGYAAKIAQGMVNCSCTDWFDKKSCTGVHAWVELILPIEATSGTIIPADVYKRCYTFGYYGAMKT